MSQTEAASQPAAESIRALRRRYLWIVGSVAFAAFMSKLDSYIVNISLPTIAQYFGVSTGEVSWTVMVYLLVSTSCLLLIGRLGDRVGLKRVFILGYVLFAFGSLLCGTAWSLWSLVAWRLVQGIGGAMLVTAGYAAMTKFLPREIVGWGFGLLSTAAGVGVIVGAPLGGIISRFLSWHWIFLINVPVGIAAVVVAVKVLPSDEPAPSERPTAFDFPGAILSFAGLAFLLCAINMGDEHGWVSAHTIASFVACMVLLGAFAANEMRTSHPLIDFSLLANRRFLTANFAAFFACQLMGGNAILLPFYLQIGKGLTPDKAGLYLMLTSAVTVLVAPAAGRLSDRLRPALICTIAMLLGSTACFVFSMTLSLRGLWASILYMVCYSASIGMFMSPNNSQAMELAPEGRKGVASGVFNTINVFGQVLGVALFETISASVSAPLPHGGAGPLPAAPMPEALSSGFSCAYLLGAAVCLVAASLSAVLLIRNGGSGRRPTAMR